VVSYRVTLDIPRELAPFVSGLLAAIGTRPNALRPGRTSGLSSRFACAAVDAENPEPPAHRTSELETRSASALLEQDEARFGQHPLLPGGQAAAGLPSWEKRTRRRMRPARRPTRLKDRLGSLKAISRRPAVPSRAPPCSHADNRRASQVVRHGSRNAHWRPSPVRTSPWIISQFASQSRSLPDAGVTSNWYAAGCKVIDAPSSETSLIRQGCHELRMLPGAALDAVSLAVSVLRRTRKCSLVSQGLRSPKRHVQECFKSLSRNTLTCRGPGVMAMNQGYRRFGRR